MSVPQTQAEVMFAAKEALVDLLAAELSDVQVSWAHPGQSIQRETVIVGNLRRGDQQQATIPNQRECRFSIDVAVDVAKKAGAKVVAQRTSELAASVERVVALNRELGIPELVMSAEVSSADLTEGMGDADREALFEFAVLVRARLRRVA